MTLKTLLHKATLKLKSQFTSARIDAEVLLCYALKKDRNYLYSYPEASLTTDEKDLFESLINKRLEGIPIAYLVGEREFWSLQLKVNSSTLIPRPETELLVELSLEALKSKKEAHILELGTGSGAISLALAKERPELQILAVDKSKEALAVAKFNADNYQLNSIEFAYSDWFKEIDSKQSFDLIVTNPPYIADNDPHLKEGDLRFEPLTALASGTKGLDDIEQIIKEALSRLNIGGSLLIEHGFSQKLAIQSMLKDYGYKKIESWKDWQGLDRVSGGKR